MGSYSPSVSPSLAASDIPSTFPTDVPTMSPTVSPSNTPSLSVYPTITCKDDDNFKLGYPPWEEVSFCRYIRRREDRRVSWCLEPGVHDGCPYTCGLCCRDD